MQALAGNGIRELASNQRTFLADDRTLDSVLNEATRDHRPMGRRRQVDSPRYLEQLAETAQFVEKVFTGKLGRRGIDLFEEAMSTSDFPILFGDILDRQLLGQFQSWPSIWPNYVHRSEVRDFRTVRRITNDGLNERWYPQNLTPELTGVQENDNLTEGQYTYSVQVYEKAFSINWRMLINDDLSAFQNLATRLTDGAKKSEDYFATVLFVASTGPNATFFSTTHKNLVVTALNASVGNNPPLSIKGLQDAYTILRSQVNPVTGEPIFIDMMTLMVPPALEVVMENILHGTQLLVGGYGQTGGGGDPAQQIVTNNWMNGRLKGVVNPYLPFIDTTSGNTAWYLVANPGNNRPAAEMGFLRGYDAPQLFQKLPNTMRLGGGVDPVMGDFDTMEITYKGFHVFGGSLMSPEMAVASKGTGNA